ncbi:gamma-aminobutyric acid receptor subunit beta-like [Artemia franciscana]|uniref:gamma-aminobutyric acid receptor subunit beta-like n=1 Tax=Artemia franciscana TaxID=6661 RepID=UPI0032DB6E5E
MLVNGAPIIKNISECTEFTEHSNPDIGKLVTVGETLELVTIIEKEKVAACTGYITRININDSNYDNTITPNEALQNESSVKAQDIGLIVLMHSVNKIADSESITTIKFYLQIFWEDPRLQMKRKKEVRVPFYLAKCFWQPVFYIPKAAWERRKQVIFSIYPNGSVRTTTLISLTIPYEDDLRVYPFDVLTAKFVLKSYSYSSSILKFYWLRQKILFESKLPEFKLLGIEVGAATRMYDLGLGNISYENAWVTLNLARYPQLPILSIYLPALIVVVSSWLAFLLPEREAGTKLSIGVSSFLALLMITAYAEKQTPKAPYIRGHDLFFGFCFASMFLSLIAHIHNRLCGMQNVTPSGKPKIRSCSTLSWFLLSLFLFNALYWPTIMHISGYL